MEENWKVIDWFSNKYEISTEGRIRSVNRIVNGRKVGKVLKPSVTKKGYLRVTIADDNHNKKSFKIHRLVAIAFISNERNLPMINHKDGDKKNNNMSNLEWCTNKENIRHAIEHGLFHFRKKKKA